MVATQAKNQTQISVLVVDDELIARIANKMILEELNYSVTLASDGLEALELIKNTLFDAILLDINLPKLSGIELTKMIRSSPEAIKNSFIIGITAHEDKETQEEARRAGMNEIVTKPISQEHIKNLITETINKKLD